MADIDAMLAEMQAVIGGLPEAKSDDDPGLTREEWQQHWHIPRHTARVRLKELSKAGHLEVGHRYEIGLDGRRCRVPVYRPKP